MPDVLMPEIRVIKDRCRNSTVRDATGLLRLAREHTARCTIGGSEATPRPVSHSRLDYWSSPRLSLAGIVIGGGSGAAQNSGEGTAGPAVGACERHRFKTHDNADKMTRGCQSGSARSSEEWHLTCRLVSGPVEAGQRPKGMESRHAPRALTVDC